MVKNSPTNAADTGDKVLILGLGRSPEVGNGNLPLFLPGRFHEWRSLVGYSPWGPKESTVPEQLSTHIQNLRTRRDP